MKAKFLKSLSGYDNITGERVFTHYKENEIYDLSKELFAELSSIGAVEAAMETQEVKMELETKIKAPMETKPFRKNSKVK